MAAPLIRVADGGDAPAIAELYRPFVETTRITFEEEAPDAATIAGRIADGGGLYPWLVAVDGDDLLGFVSSAPFRSRSAYRWVAESGIYVAAPAQGRGVGRSLLTGQIDLLRAQGYVALIAQIALPNAISIALHERLGFFHAGTHHLAGFKLGEWVDVGHWQRELAPRTNPPPERRPYAEVIRDALTAG